MFLFCFRWILETSGHRYANNSIYPTAAWTAGLALNKFTLGKWLRCVAIIDHLISEAFQPRTSSEYWIEIYIYVSDLYRIKLKVMFYYIILYILLYYIFYYIIYYILYIIYIYILYIYIHIYIYIYLGSAQS